MPRCASAPTQSIAGGEPLGCDTPPLGSQGMNSSAPPATDEASAPSPQSIQDAGVFKLNRSQAIHRWYPFVEGFASDLVNWAIEAGPVDRPRIFDPFGGSGTTALAASTRGLDSAFCEVNPFLAWLAEVKVNRACRATANGELTYLREFSKIVTSWGDRPLPMLNSDHPLAVAERKRSFFPAGVVDEILTALSLVEGDWPSDVSELGRAAIAVSLVPSSNMVRRTDLRRRTKGDPPPVPFRQALFESIRKMLEDLTDLDVAARGRTKLLAHDIRTLDSRNTERFDLLVTSPPYLNGTNYERNTKLELLALGMIASEADLAPLRTDSITAGINGVSKRRPTPSEIPEVEAYATVLDEVAYDVRIPALVRGYFSDMQIALSRMRAVAESDSELLLDIGDSRFAGVTIPTHELLTVLAAEQGWQLKEEVHLRDRRSFDGTPLVQVLLKFTATHV